MLGHVMDMGVARASPWGGPASCTYRTHATRGMRRLNVVVYLYLTTFEARRSVCKQEPVYARRRHEFFTKRTRLRQTCSLNARVYSSVVYYDTVSPAILRESVLNIFRKLATFNFHQYEIPK